VSHIQIKNNARKSKDTIEANKGKEKAEIAVADL